MKRKLLGLFLTILVSSQLVTLPIVTSNAASPQEKRSTRDSINIALILQRWDYMDALINTYVVPIYHIRMLQIQKQYSVDINFKIFWDDLDGGDVQGGKLISENIDVAIGPGGTGSFYTPELYRQQLKTFIENGGGFFGICGDSYLGAEGYINSPDDFKELLKKLFGYPDITPSLNLIPVICDAQPFTELFNGSNTQNNLFVFRTLIELIFSNSMVQISDTPLPFADDLRGKTIAIETGSCPLVLNTSADPSDYTLIGTYLKSKSPYNSSLFEGKVAVISSTSNNGRVILTPLHPEASLLRNKANHLFIEGVLWLAKKDTLI